MRITYGNRNLVPRKWRRLARKLAGGSTVTPIHKSLTKTVNRSYTQNKQEILNRQSLAELLTEEPPRSDVSIQPVA